jgi:hypothetical protein
MVQFAAADRGGSNDEGAIGNGFGDSLKLFRAGEQRGGADGGTGLAKGDFVRVDHAQTEEPEVAHGASGGADIERVARGHQDHA